MIFDILDQLAVKGKAILVCTHDLGSLQKEFQRAIFIDRSVVADGPVAQVVNMEMLAGAYGFSPHICPPELRSPFAARVTFGDDTPQECFAIEGMMEVAR